MVNPAFQPREASMIPCPRCRHPLDEERWRCPGCGLRADQGPWLDYEPRDAAEWYFDPLEFRYRHGAEQHHFWHRARRTLLLELLRGFLAPGSLLLEVGCGCGHLAASFTRAGFRVWGSDLSVEALRWARQQGLERLARASILELPFEDHFDATCAFDVLEHVPEHGRALAGLIRATRPGGLVFLTVPAHPHLWGSWDRKQRHVRRYRAGELQRLVEGAGLDILLLREFCGALYLPCLASAAFDRLAGGDRRRDLPVEQHHAMWDPPLLGWLAHGLLSREAQAIREPSRVRGSSLLVVARRPG
jgi:SAM-dependent methyltransferase